MTKSFDQLNEAMSLANPSALLRTITVAGATVLVSTEKEIFVSLYEAGLPTVRDRYLAGFRVAFQLLK